MDPKALEDRRAAIEEAADHLRRDVPRITILNEPLRHHEGDGSLPAESADALDETR